MRVRGGNRGAKNHSGPHGERLRQWKGGDFGLCLRVVSILANRHEKSTAKTTSGGGGEAGKGQTTETEQQLRWTAIMLNHM